MSKRARDRKRSRRFLRRIARLALPILEANTRIVIGRFK